LYGRYLKALSLELSTLQTGFDLPVDAIYLGGGTPSLLEPEQVGMILDAASGRFGLAEDTEVSLEANPDDLDQRKVSGLLKAGINRITLGVQSLDDEVLVSVGRRHDSSMAVDSLRVAREAGFANIGVDLILGLPGEDLSSFPARMATMLDQEPDHLSLYLLETDKDTPLARQIRAGEQVEPEGGLLLQTFNICKELLEDRGLARYEISNFARPGKESRHNLKYWTDQPYGGFGAAAHGYYGGARYANPESPEDYIGTLADPEPSDPWNPGKRAEEALFMGLRLVEGVDLDSIGERYGIDLWHAYDDLWGLSERQGMLFREGGRIRLTGEGMMRSNLLFREIVGRLEEGDR
jgi:oxygen-independent coproporphyrinogen-3 oxidase